MSKFKPTLGTKYQAENSKVNDGQFIVATDSRELFYDDGSLRVPLTDIVFLSSEAEKKSILAPLQKFYFVIESSKLYLWDGNEWTAINSEPFDENSMPEAGSLPTVLYVKNGKVRPLALGKEGEVLTVSNSTIAWQKHQFL